MIEAYRICKDPNSASAFSGQGSKDWGGRWNSKGVAVVYAAAHRSLSMLEILAHVKGGSGTGTGSIGKPFLIYTIAFDEALLEELSHSSLPTGWSSEPPTAAGQSIGDAWVVAAASPVLAVPSVLVPEERNYVLNPNHPRFSHVRIGAGVVCRFAPRLL